MVYWTLLIIEIINQIVYKKFSPDFRPINRQNTMYSIESHFIKKYRANSTGVQTSLYTCIQSADCTGYNVPLFDKQVF